MDFKEIECIIKAVSESNLSSLDIECDGVSIKMKKEKDIVCDKIISKDQLPLTEDKYNVEEIVEEEIEDENYVTVVSPIVGTFYESSGVGKEPYVKVGDKIKKGDILCIVEAMKVMNEIESEIDGEVVSILVKNEDMVEYGEDLFKIRPL
ncbi:acetyl-CoA carboxylase biotin carboxyl carrier protein [Clostridium niameyense]|uniref:Biotin carboxyl carrier protein of acetyl-CoA carboxylase n=1 Tax=Clostridium niameyense TaxID=1622073 RepID=A0A6M0RD04_9CLOT|nr:acetyl-CoA carboxylase biotin carboxyl carrier protein [Clostridium niameyense]NEZ47630.1 acetyl-CoA carboxylase biotin carboxyl carrier protein [Clostridium niameyense]